jgi:hypothetical protein
VSWRGTVMVPGRRLHVGTTPAGRCSVWHYVDGAPVVLARGRVRGMVELYALELVHGTEADADVLRRWLKERITT